MEVPFLSRSHFGTQIWLQTPIEGFRLGIAGNRKTETLPLPPAGPGGKETAKSLHASIDLDLEQFLFQAEYHQMKTFVAEDPVISHFADPLDVKYYIVRLAVSF